MYRKTPLILTATLILIASIASAAAEQEQTEQQNRIVAKVNGQPIYEKELDESLALRFNKKKKYGMQMNHTDPDVMYAIKKQVLDDLIDSAVIYQAAKSTKLPDVEEKVNQKILSLASTFGSEEKYDKFLHTKNTSLEKKREFFKNNFMVQAYFDKMGLTKPEIPEEKIKELYEQEKKSFKLPEQVKFSQVFLKVDKKATPEERKRIEKKAEEAHKMLVDGKSFSEVADELSKNGDLEISGGERGYLRRGMLPKSVEEVAFSIMPWKISDIVRSEFGYHILMISDKKPERYTPYEKVHDFLKKYLETEAVRENVTRHTKELRSKAKIEIFLKKRPSKSGSGEKKQDRGAAG